MSSARLSRYFCAILILIFGLLLMRIGGLLLSPLNLHGDEAQYWAWAQDMQWGYFTKPPGIAAVIWVTTGLFGDAEWAVRLGSPVLHSFTAFVLFITGRRFLSEAAGFWAAVVYLVMPALWLSSGIISTDVPLLLCWSLALLSWLALRKSDDWESDDWESDDWAWAAGLGIMIGLGLMSKYAMLFFLPSLGLAIVFDAPTRRALISAKGVLAALLTALIILPNVMWNMDNDFATLHHTVANANIDEGMAFHPVEMMKFLMDQLGVFGPLSFIMLIMAIIAALRAGYKNAGGMNAGADIRFWLAVFAITPLLIISFEALISRANANWAVTAYISGALLLADYCVGAWARLKKWLGGALAVNITAGLVMTALALSPALANSLGAANAFKHVRAWPETTSGLAERFAQGHEGRAYTGFAFDKRIQYYDVNYYGLAKTDSLYKTAPLYMWLYKAYPENQAELSAPLPSGEGPYLVVNYYDIYVDEFEADFARLEPLPPLDIDLGGGNHRRLVLWAGYGYTPTSTRY